MEKPKPNLGSYFPVVFVIVLIIFLYTIFLVNQIPLVQLQDTDMMYPSSTVVNFIVTNVFFVLSMYCLIRVAWTNPGSIPKISPWDPRAESIAYEGQVEKLSSLLGESSEAETNDVANMAPGQGDVPKDTSESDLLLKDSKPINEDSDIITSANVKDDKAKLHDSAQMPQETRASSHKKIPPTLDFRGVERKRNGEARRCRVCFLYKPDRAHHSRNLNTCVLEMDHYCPWIRNCIGLYNKKYFVLFLLYTVICLICYLVALSNNVGRFFAPRTAPKSVTVEEFLTLFAFIVAFLFTVVLGCYCIFHFWLMSKNYTTIEFCEKRRASSNVRTMNGEKLNDLYKRSPYDVGLVNNLRHFLGPYFILWFVPTRAFMNHDGLVYQVDDSHPLYRPQQHDLIKRVSSQSSVVYEI